MHSSTIPTVIIDDNRSSINQLCDALETFEDIEIVKTTTSSQRASILISEFKPKLIFLDVEMPGKDGFEVLRELNGWLNYQAKVVFYTAFDKYLLEAIRNSAFDYLLKPVEYKDLWNLISRIRKEGICNYSLNEKAAKMPVYLEKSQIFLPSPTGLRLVNKSDIVLFSFHHESEDPQTWYALLADQTKLPIKKKLNAKKIMQIVDDPGFFRINQSTIINMQFLSGIENKNRSCILIPPFTQLDISVSRRAFSELKEKIDVL